MSSASTTATHGGDDPTVLEGRVSDDAPVPVSRPGTQIGRYVVLEEIGRGGMGAVLRAYDPKLRREVALKRVTLSRDDPEARARLVREAQAMAQLSHPNTVAVYDVDIDDAGEVTLAMEYVGGASLETWLREERPWRQVVAVLAAAGEGLAAAHRAEIVHRDFKPGNVLVRSGDGAVKVTDFGLATFELAADASDGLDRSFDGLGVDDELTRASRVMGTPRYMAPEQHAGSVLRPAADQYAFCVTAWRALTGVMPFTNDDMEGLVAAKHDGPPSWPRASDVPPRITDAIRRGLDPNPARRWPDMASLLSHLRPEAPARARGVATLAAVVLTASVVGGAVWLVARDEPCADAQDRLADVYSGEARARVGAAIANAGPAWAEDASNRTVAALDQWASQWRTEYTEACAATSIRGEQSTELLDKRMACLRRAKADLAGAMSVLGEADAQVAERAIDVANAVPPPSRCADLEALQAEVAPPDPSQVATVEDARAKFAEAKSLRSAGKYAPALELLAQTPDDVEYLPYLAERDYLLGVVSREVDPSDAPVDALRRSLERALEAGDLEMATQAAAQLSLQLAETPAGREGAREIGMVSLALARRWTGRRGEALRGLAHTVLGVVLRKNGDFEGALHHMKEALRRRIELSGANHPSVALSRNSLGNVYIRQGRNEDAEREYRAALELRLVTLGPDHPHVATSHNNLAGALFYLGRGDEAIDHWREAIRIYRATLGPRHPNVAMAHQNIGALRIQQGHGEEGIVELDEALGIYREVYGTDHLETAQARAVLGHAYQSLARYDDAVTELTAALAVLDRDDPRDVETGSAHYVLGVTYHELHRDDDARGHLERAIEIRQTRYGPDHDDVKVVQTALAALAPPSGE